MQGSRPAQPHVEASLKVVTNFSKKKMYLYMKLNET